MTTLSLLRDVKELESVKVKYLPFTDRNGYHKDDEWLRTEYQKWSNQFLRNNQRVDQLTVDMCSILYKEFSESKERLLNIAKIVGFLFYIDEYVMPARVDRSAAKMEKLFGDLSTTLKTQFSDQSFVIGKRFADALNIFKSELTGDQWKIFENHLEMAFEAHVDIHCNYWLKDKVIPFEDYLFKRKREAFWLFIISILMEYCVGFVMSSHIRNHRLVKEFTEKSVELVLAVDDYYITKMKLMSNDTTSRVICLLNEKRVDSLQEAIDSQLEYTLDLYKQCNHLKDQINADSEISSEQLRNWMEISLDNSRRFFPFVSNIQDLRVNDDQTLRSAKWDQLYSEIQEKCNKKVDPHFLYNPSNQL